MTTMMEMMTVKVLVMTGMVLLLSFFIDPRSRYTEGFSKSRNTGWPFLRSSQKKTRLSFGVWRQEGGWTRGEGGGGQRWNDYVCSLSEPCVLRFDQTRRVEYRLEIRGVTRIVANTTPINKQKKVSETSLNY